MVRSWTEIENNIVSVERVKEYSRTPKEVDSQLLTGLAQEKSLRIRFVTFLFHMENPSCFCPFERPVIFPLKNCSILIQLTGCFVTSDYRISMRQLRIRLSLK